jgi:hypothetical protein
MEIVNKPICRILVESDLGIRVFTFIQIYGFNLAKISWDASNFYFSLVFYVRNDNVFDKKSLSRLVVERNIRLMKSQAIFTSQITRLYDF